MTWARIYPIVTNWPGGGSPPVFDIASDVDGTAVVELAWDPQALRNPASYSQPLRYYSTDVPFLASVRRADGSTLSVSVPAQTIAVTGNRGRWVMPAALWSGFLEESLKRLSSPPATTFSGNIYYRVRVTATGASSATPWPTDATLTGPDARHAPHVGVLPMSAVATSLVGLDLPAVQAMGGLPFAPTFWSDLLTGLWKALPETDANRQLLAQVMAHPTYKAMSVADRGQTLRLWLVSGRARTSLPALLSRQVPVAAGATVPIVSKPALKGGRTLIPLLLDLVSITPHPDLQHYTADQLVADVITEILDPNGQVNQGLAGTCSPTSMQALLIACNPAEYARLQIGWLSSDAEAELADGTTAEVPPSVFQTARYSAADLSGFLMRTFSEIAFQGAMIKLGQGSAFPSSDGTEATLAKVFKAVYGGGLSVDQAKTCLEALFHTTFTRSTVAWPPGPVTFPLTQLNIQLNLVNFLTTKKQPAYLSMYWVTPPSTPIPSGKTAADVFSGHALVALRHENGRVVFKNPQYAGSSPVPGMVNGGNESNPPRRHEEVSQSLESMADADLALWIKAYLAPDNPIL